MFPADLIDVHRAPDGELTPRYLTDLDHAWVRAIHDVFEASLGGPRHALESRLRATTTEAARPRARRAMEHLLARLHGFTIRATLPPAAVRRRVFDLAGAAPDAPVEAIWRRAAASLGVPPEAARACLYADLPAFRVLEPPEAPIATAELIPRYNLTLAQALLRRAEHLTVTLRGEVKQVIRFARLQRLLIQARRDAMDASRTVLDVSGPLSLFRFTTRYGHAMAHLAAALTRVEGWRLVARCVLRDGPGTFRASHLDPIGTTHAPARRFDSRLEARFFRSIMRHAPDWEVLREACATAVGRRIVCPDFTLVHRGDGHVVPVELVGYWTPEYLADKLATVRALRERGERWLLCVDRRLAAGRPEAAELAAHPDTLLFDRRLRAAEVVDAARRLAGVTMAARPRLARSAG